VHKLGWVLKDKNPTTFIFYPPLKPLPRGDFSNSPLERGRGVFNHCLIKKD